MYHANELTIRKKELNNITEEVYSLRRFRSERTIFKKKSGKLHICKAHFPAKPVLSIQTLFERLLF